MSGCPIDAGFDPLSADYLRDPYPILRAVRERTPVCYAPSIDMWVVTRHADVRSVFVDPETFSASITQTPLFAMTEEAREILGHGLRQTPVLVNCDPPAHTRVRARVSQALSPRRVAALEPSIRRRAASLIDAFPEGRVDVVRALSFPLPALTIFDLIGFPESDAERIKAWCETKLVVNWGRPPAEMQVASAYAMVAFWEYCERFVDRRRLHRADDLTSELLAQADGDPDGLNPNEVASVVFAFSFAGHETTTNLITNCLHQVLRQPGLWGRIRADRSLVPGTVEETLRHDSSVIAWRRIATRDARIGDVDVPRGARILVVMGAANRDPAVFEDPDRFDPERANARQHLSFGRSIHFCMGASLARLEAAIVLELLTERSADLRLAPGDEPAFSANVSFRGPSELWLERCSGPQFSGR